MGFLPLAVLSVSPRVADPLGMGGHLRPRISSRFPGELMLLAQDPHGQATTVEILHKDMFGSTPSCLHSLVVVIFVCLGLTTQISKPLEQLLGRSQSMIN